MRAALSVPLLGAALVTAGALLLCGLSPTFRARQSPPAGAPLAVRGLAPDDGLRGGVRDLLPGALRQQPLPERLRELGL